MKYLIVICSFILFISACKKDEETSVDVGYNYFPYRVGSVHIYHVDSTVYNSISDTTEQYIYELREVVESTFTDNQGREAFRIERYKRDSDTLPWQIYNVWSAVLTSTTAERVEDNQRYIKLVFPVEDGKVWNGNSFNSMDEQEYKYIETEVPSSVDALSFEKTLTVLQADENNLVFRKYSVEKFARDVGLFYKEYHDYDYNTPSPVPKDGVKVIMELKSYSL